MSSGLAVNTSKRMLAAYPTAMPANMQPISANVELTPKLLLTGDAATTPTSPPAMHAMIRVCTVHLLKTVIGGKIPGKR